MRTLLFPLGSLIVLAACGSDPKPVAQAPTAPPPAVTTPPPPEKVGDVPTRSNINISDDIRKACGINDADAYFAFDSANVRPQDQAILQKLASCFSTGPLKGRTMRLVGHADPRGDEEYNMVLGGRRADNVKGAIVNAGLASSKIATTSRGEMDATGTDEAGWEKDRRVDVMLGS
ncbi:MAG TPA: OmpA family protein [Polyangiaceae bacterium]|nr:OmpA family protein [Polyangiaceae bacterium]